MTSVAHGRKGPTPRMKANPRPGSKPSKSSRSSRSFPLVVGISVAVVALVGGVSISNILSQPPHPTAVSATVSTMLNPAAGANATLSTAGPPWPLPSSAAVDIAVAGLHVAGQEATTVHYHAHLDIIVNGEPLSVPAGIGFEFQDGQVLGLTSVHTHDASGVIHIEAPTASAFSLGQFFVEWGVYLGNGRLGGLVSGYGEVLRTYVNGHLFAGDPASIALGPHEEIALWYGSTSSPVHVPDTYQFPVGE